MLPLSPSCDGVSWKVSQTCEPTNSGVEDVRASEQHALLSFVDPLASDSRPSPDVALIESEARVRGRCACPGTVARLTVSRLLCRHSIAQVRREVKVSYSCLRAAGFSSPASKDGGFQARYSVIGVLGKVEGFVEIANLRQRISWRGGHPFASV